MIYIVDNIFNYIIYLFIIHHGFRINPRKNRFMVCLSVFFMIAAGSFNAYFDINSPIMYIIWSLISIILFFDDNLTHLIILSFGLMYFTGIVDTFSVMLIQVILIGGGIICTDITWWMEPAYILSLLVYLLIYFKLLKKNEVYLCDIELKYKIALLVQGSIFQMFYNLVFSFFNENGAMYGWNAYVTFFVSIIGVIYSIFITLSLAIKNILSNWQNRDLQFSMYMQKQQYEYQLQQSVAIRRFRHDLVNHIGALRELINQNKINEAKKYIETIWNIQEEIDLKIHTGDSFLDVIINYYLYLASKEEIDFIVNGKLTDKIPVNMVDLTSLVGNLLQNAIEAAKKTDYPQITIEFIEHKKEVFIIVKNSTVNKIEIKNGLIKTTKQDKENHGFGLKNINMIIEKYYGEYYTDLTDEDGKIFFRTCISIPRSE